MKYVEWSEPQDEVGRHLKADEQNKFQDRDARHASSL
jgi:hypothetical protein